MKYRRAVTGKRSILEVGEEKTFLKLLLRFPTPVRQSSRVGQAILRSYLEPSHDQESELPSPVERSFDQ